jgi:hypothetical protein
MSDIALCLPRLPAMREEAIATIRKGEDYMLTQPQVAITTHHVLHGGMYLRTICLPKGVALTSALFKIPTAVILSGDVRVFVGDEKIDFVGYHVLPASAGRKTGYLAFEDTMVTMVFPTKATTVEQAEAEFTDEAERLFSRRGENVVVITGE